MKNHPDELFFRILMLRNREHCERKQNVHYLCRRFGRRMEITVK